jgi:hypothetical protein
MLWACAQFNVDLLRKRRTLGFFFLLVTGASVRILNTTLKYSCTLRAKLKYLEYRSEDYCKEWPRLQAFRSATGVKRIVRTLYGKMVVQALSVRGPLLR